MPAKFLLPVFFLLTLNACVGGGASPDANFYMLEPMSEQAPAAASNFSIGMSPVKIASYLDRPQIVTANAKNSYRLSEFNRWAEPLDQNITRVLAQNLTQSLSADVLMTHQSGFAKQADIRVDVTISAFHVAPQGQAVLSAHALISRNKKLLSSKQFSYRVDASNTDYRLLVAGLNECLSRLSGDIADIVRNLVVAPPPAR